MLSNENLNISFDTQQVRKHLICIKKCRMFFLKKRSLFLNDAQNYLLIEIILLCFSCSSPTVLNHQKSLYGVLKNISKIKLFFALDSFQNYFDQMLFLA